MTGQGVGVTGQGVGVTGQGAGLTGVNGVNGQGVVLTGQGQEAGLSGMNGVNGLTEGLTHTTYGGGENSGGDNNAMEVLTACNQVAPLLVPTIHAPLLVLTIHYTLSHYSLLAIRWPPFLYPQYISPFSSLTIHLHLFEGYLPSPLMLVLDTHIIFLLDTNIYPYSILTSTPNSHPIPSSSSSPSPVPFPISTLPLHHHLQLLMRNTPGDKSAREIIVQGK